MAIGDQVLDMKAAVEAGLFGAAAADAAADSTLNRLMTLPAPALSGLRVRLQAMLESGWPDQAQVEPCLAPASDVEMHLPAATRAFTDFMTSPAHIAAERPARPAGPVPPCFWTLPIGYNSRASSIVVSGAAVRRPLGQFQERGQVVVGPTRSLDYELEFAALIGRGNPLGEPLAVAARATRTSARPSSAQTHRVAIEGAETAVMAKSDNPFRWLDSSSEAIRLVVMLYVRCQVNFALPQRPPTHLTHPAAVASVHA